MFRERAVRMYLEQLFKPGESKRCAVGGGRAGAGQDPSLHRLAEQSRTFVNIDQIADDILDKINRNTNMSQRCAQ